VRKRATLAEVTIESVAAGGDGVGHLPDGRVVFVSLTAPGDRVRVRIEEDRARFARASLETLISDGPSRCEPRCPVFGSCGGCAWQHIRYEDQLEAKRRILADALARIGGFDLSEAPVIHPSPEPYHYRARTRVLVRGGLLGYRRRRSHRLCAIESCPILAPPVDDLLHRIAEEPESWLTSGARPVGDKLRVALGEQPEEEWELCAGSRGEARSWRIPQEPPAECDGRPQRAESSRSSHVDTSLREGPPVTIALKAGPLQVSPGVFMQANALLWQDLVDAVVAQAASGADDARGRLIELFAGAGFFTLSLASHFSHVIAVESDARAVRDLTANLEVAGLAHVDVVAEPVDSALCYQWGSPDCVVLDPPRTGLSRDAVRRLAELDARRIVYLSCDPATLARDLRLLCDERPSYRLIHTSAFDLFPQTPHVEGLAVLEQTYRNAPA
jgi:23S rRNA (uracil1939-C5)-methyltransferase